MVKGTARICDILGVFLHVVNVFHSYLYLSAGDLFRLLAINVANSVLGILVFYQKWEIMQ